jgi:hypothetical protein
MRQTVLITALAAALALPAAAQEETAPETPTDRDGGTLMEEGARMILRGLLQELEPAIEDLESRGGELREGFEALASEMGPAIRDILRLVDEARYYEAPEVLPNGDIVIRRKPDAPPYVPEETGNGDEAVDL